MLVLVMVENLEVWTPRFMKTLHMVYTFLGRYAHKGLTTS
jgi:hypothetical protein